MRKKICYRLPIILSYYFPVFLCAGLTIYAMQRWEISMPQWVDSYVNDFLCMPIVLYICRYVVRLIRSDSELLLPLRPIVFLTLGYTLYFEYYLPTVNVRYTGDIIDIALYFMGSGFFYYIQYLRFVENEKRIDLVNFD